MGISVFDSSRDRFSHAQERDCLAAVGCGNDMFVSAPDDQKTGEIDDKGIPMRYEIDYVRVYQK